jgi:hypothetical protein
MFPSAVGATQARQGYQRYKRTPPSFPRIAKASQLATCGTGPSVLRVNPSCLWASKSACATQLLQKAIIATIACTSASNVLE